MQCLGQGPDEEIAVLLRSPRFAVRPRWGAWGGIELRSRKMHWIPAPGWKRTSIAGMRFSPEGWQKITGGKLCGANG